MRKEKVSETKENEMLPKYDFRGGVRGKHYEAYRRGYSVTIHKIGGERERKMFSDPKSKI